MNTYENFITANNALMEWYKQTEPSAYHSITPFDKKSLCQDKRKAVAEFITGGPLTSKNLVSEKLMSICFCDLPKERLQKSLVEVEPGTQHEVTGENGIELGIQHRLSWIQSRVSLTFNSILNILLFQSSQSGIYLIKHELNVLESELHILNKSYNEIKADFSK